jgi:hypothetical protein
MKLHEAIEEMHEWIEAAKHQSPGAILNIGTKVQVALPVMQVVVKAAELHGENPTRFGEDYAPAARWVTFSASTLHGRSKHDCHLRAERRCSRICRVGL